MFRRLIVIAGLIVALAATSVLAQGLRRRANPEGRQGQGRGQGQRIERLQERLNLTEAQMNEIRALQEIRRKEAEAANQRFLAAVRDLLTPEQQQQLPKRLR
jgi:Spy/CpxP family protein refolding chaperone